MIKLFVGFLIIFVVIVYIAIRNALEIKQCPNCGHDMVCYYNKETKSYEYECEICGNKEGL